LVSPEIVHAQHVLASQADRYLRLVEETPEEALSWHPDDGTTNSIAQIVRHVAASERLLLGFARDAPVVRSDEEYQRYHAHSLRETPTTRVELRQTLIAMQAETERDLDALVSLGLDGTITTYSGGHLTRRQLLTHHMLHLAEHIGHAELTRQLWEQRAASESL
jgi:hypothetical protein